MSFPPTVFSEAPSPSINVLTDILRGEGKIWLAHKQAGIEECVLEGQEKVIEKHSPARLAIALSPPP